MDESLQAELERIRAKADEELKIQKRQAEEIHSSEVKLLREQLENAKEHVDKLDLKLKAKERQYDDLMSE